MTLQTMSFIFGALLLAVSILGGGFEVKEVKVSNATVGVRIMAGIVGLLFIGLGFWQQLSDVLEPPRMDPPPTPTTRHNAPPPPSKPAEALVAEQLPFVSDRDRITVGTVYVPAQDYKALAISHSRIGMLTGQADI